MRQMHLTSGFKRGFEVKSDHCRVVIKPKYEQPLVDVGLAGGRIGFMGLPQQGTQPIRPSQPLLLPQRPTATVGSQMAQLHGSKNQVLPTASANARPAETITRATRLVQPDTRSAFPQRRKK